MAAILKSKSTYKSLYIYSKYILPIIYFLFTSYYIVQPLRYKSTFFINKILRYQAPPL